MSNLDAFIANPANYGLLDAMTTLVMGSYYWGLIVAGLWIIKIVLWAACDFAMRNH